MTAKELKKILNKIPDDTIICRPIGEEGCDDLDTVRYCPQYNILYISTHWDREERNKSLKMNPHEPRLDKFMLRQIRDFARTGKKIVDEKHDGKMHTIQIILSQWDEYILGIIKKHHEWLSLVVDDTRERGGKLGVGKQTVLLSFEWESLVVE